MSETQYGGPAEYGPSYSYLLECQDNWKKPSYRAWWLTRVYLEVVRPLALPQESKILSVGAGMGHIEQFLVSPFGYDVTAIDFNLPSLQVATSLFSDRVSFIAADVLKLPFKDSSFDAVISYDLIEHLPSESRAELALREMERVLKRGGPMFHKITVLGEDGIDQDATHHIKKSSKNWEYWFQEKGWKTYKPSEHFVPIWSRKRVGRYPVKGAFYIRRST